MSQNLMSAPENEYTHFKCKLIEKHFVNDLKIFEILTKNPQ